MSQYPPPNRSLNEIQHYIQSHLSNPDFLAYQPTAAAILMVIAKDLNHYEGYQLSKHRARFLLNSIIVLSIWMLAFAIIYLVTS